MRVRLLAALDIVVVLDKLDTVRIGSAARLVHCWSVGGVDLWLVVGCVRRHGDVCNLLLVRTGLKSNSVNE